MSSPDYHIEQIRKLNEEAKRLNAQLRVLRTHKRDHERHIYQYMTRNNLTTYKSFRIDKIAPKTPTKRIPAAEKKRAALDLCRMTGIPDPESFIREFKATQSAAKPPSSSSSSS